MLRYFTLLLFSLSLAVAGCSTGNRTQSSQRKLVLLTTFEPFGKWKVNLSHDVAQGIARLKAELGDAVDVEICRLPVQYDIATSTALKCLDRLPRKPDLVVSLGEGKCGILLETAATNIDHKPELPDNGGVVRTLSTIVPEAERRLPFTLPIDEMFCALPEAYKSKVSLSVSAGNYVCNNTGYRLARHFKDKSVPYGIIHLPHSGCSDDIRNPDRNAEIVTQLLSVALRRLSSEAAESRDPLPTTEEQVLTLLTKSPATTVGRSCRRTVLDQLLIKYEEAKKKTTIRM